MTGAYVVKVRDPRGPHPRRWFYLEATLTSATTRHTAAKIFYNRKDADHVAADLNAEGEWFARVRPAR